MVRNLWRAVIEALTGIKRNLLVSFVCVSTVALSMLIVAVFVMVALNVEFIADSIEEQVEIKIYLVDDLTHGYIEDLQRAILNTPGVRDVRFISKEQGLEELKQQLGAEHGLLEAVTEMNPLPDSFDIRVNPDRLDQVVTNLRELPGIDTIRDKRELVEQLLSLTRGIRTAGLFLAGLMMFASLFIIANTIRIAVFTRRTQIGIMKLVGATDGFIRLPFVIEGMILGALGSGIAAFIAWHGYGWLQINIARALPFLPLLPREPVIEQVVHGVVIAGAIVGAVGSFISTRRYLRI